MGLDMKKVLAVIAHDSKKDDIIQLIKAHKEEVG
jgi:methylglyoxal synthase